MATLLDIRKRISTVKNIEKITKAMKMVAAAKLRRSQEALMKVRPYARHMRDVMGNVAARVAEDAHPLLARHGDSRSILLVNVAADRGLCGSFNANVYRQGRKFLADQSGFEPHLLLIGRKAVAAHRATLLPVLGRYTDIYKGLDFPVGSRLGKIIVDDYLAKKHHAVYVAYNEFKSAAAQNLVIERLLPIEQNELAAGKGGDYLYEPARPDEVLSHLLKLYIEVRMYTVLLESFAAEQAARMTAMNSATDNAVSMRGALTLTYNRLRQAAITKEISEIVGGAEALK